MKWNGWFPRFVRVAVAVLIAGVIAQYGNSPYYLALAPVLSALFKWLRDVGGIDVKIL